MSDIVSNAGDGAHTVDEQPAEACCDMHNENGCCDPDDCGPCCPSCPTCPTVRAGKAPRALMV